MESQEEHQNNPAPEEDAQGASIEDQESTAAAHDPEFEFSPTVDDEPVSVDPQEQFDGEMDEVVEPSVSPPRTRSRSVYIAFFLVLIVGVVLIALFQFNRGLSLPSSLTSLLGGAQTTASGLIIEDLVNGSGPEVKAGDAITVDYTGFLEDGTQFDSSITRGQPFTFLVGYGSVIPGWDEGVLGMQEGGVRRLTIPPDLAYGEAGAGEVIPPNSTLSFELELLGIHTVEIEELAEGQGEEIAPGDNVTLEYTVWLMDGTEIDSSATSGQPIVFTVGSGQMLPGVEQGIAGMKLGEKRLVTIPPELAFGDQGLGDLVPPGASLQFELELVDVQ
ncbi:MAG TPA: FKBP-type peptidyl-prolyl cis-trans isomerase [Anaerolineales bacterium]|nr:FKBP-type peptidyl-prolyl cis-trans isomerase [Anaerolineales bacterium]